MGKGDAQLQPVTRDYTINLGKRLHKCTFKRKARTAIQEIKKFARSNMLTDDVRIHQLLNQYVWKNGIRNVPRKVRVRMSRRRDEDDEVGGKFYTMVKHVPVTSFKGLLTEKETGGAEEDD